MALLLLPEAAKSATLGPEGSAASADSIEICFQWGKNSLDTKAGTLTKDLILDGTLTARFYLSEEQKRSILAKADSGRFWELPPRIEPSGPEAVHAEPCRSFCLIISAGTRVHAVAWSTCWYLPTDEWQRAMKLGLLIERIVRQSAAFQALPAARGSYL